MRTLPNDTVLYRAITKKTWIDIDTQEIDEEAFLLRFKPTTGKYEENLSAAVLPEHCYQNLSKCFGIISFTVENVRQLGLDAIQDKPTHVSIINIPNIDTDKKKALDIAAKLARKAKLHTNWLNNPYKKK